MCSKTAPFEVENFKNFLGGPPNPSSAGGPTPHAAAPNSTHDMCADVYIACATATITSAATEWVMDQ